MQATEKLFTSRRFHQITLDDVARAAGVGKGTIYQYFTNKEDLFIQTATHGFDELCRLVTDTAAPEACFAEQLLSISRQIDAFFSRRRQLFRMMQSEEARMQMCKGQPRRHWAEQRAKLVRAVTRVVEKGVAERAIRDDVAAEMLASLLLGMLRTRHRNSSAQATPPWPLDTIVDLFCNGARVPAGQANSARLRAGSGK